MGTPFGLKYIPYTYMDPLGVLALLSMVGKDCATLESPGKAPEP